MIQLRAMFVVCALLLTAAFGQPFWGEYNVPAAAGGGITVVTTQTVADMSATTTPRNIGGTVSLQAGDIVVLAGIGAHSGGGQILSFGEDGGASVVEQETSSSSNYSPILLSTYTATTTETVQFTVARSTTDDPFGAGLVQVRGATSIGNSVVATPTVGLPSESLTTAGDNALIVMVESDWNALDSDGVWLTSAGAVTEMIDYHDGTWYGARMAYHADTGSAGSKTIGMSAPTGQQYQFAGVGIEP